MDALGRLGGWMNGWTPMDRWIEVLGWTDEWMNRQMDGMDGWTDELMDRCMDWDVLGGQMDGWDGPIDGWMDEWTH